MDADQRIVAIVPARAGSKGLPGKNLAEIDGRTLVARAVDVALRVERIDAVIVSSDSAAILEEGANVGATPVRRPDELCGDDAATDDVIRHAIASSGDATAVVILQPTSPLRVADDVRRCLDAFDGVNPVATVTAVSHPVEWTFRVQADGSVDPVLGWGGLSRRQDQETAYRLNGAVFVVASERLLAGHPTLGPGLRAVVMPPERSIDIDTAADLEAARAVAAAMNEPEDATEANRA